MYGGLKKYSGEPKYGRVRISNGRPQSSFQMVLTSLDRFINIIYLCSAVN